MDEKNFCRMVNWYPFFAGKTFMTSFVKLRSEAIQALANGETEGSEGSAVDLTIKDLRKAMSLISGNSFVSVDLCSPTDTERFETKRGAVYSAESAWFNLASSTKVRQSAAAGEVEYISIRPFRRMNRPREFRLFIKDGKLKAMSQYYLIRHFRRLEGVKNNYWEMAKNFVDEISWNLPIKDIVMDIYFTSNQEIYIVDFNPWGNPTDQLMLNSWERDWSEEIGIILMPPPMSISGDVNISF